MSVAIAPGVIMTPLNGVVGGSTNKNTALNGTPAQVVAQGRLVTQPVDCGLGTYGEFSVDLMATNAPIATAMPAGSLVLEVSGDGGGFWPVPAAASNVPQISAPVAVTAATEGRYPIPFAGSKGWRYARVRYQLTGGVTLSAIQSAATTTPASAVQALAMTSDELFLAVATTTAAGLNIYGWAQTTTPTAAAATSTNFNALVGTTIQPGGINFYPAAPATATNNQYYLAAAGATTPFASIVPISSAGVAGVVIQPAVGGITVGKAAFWWPTQSGDTTFFAYVGTTTPFIQVYAFNVRTSTLGQIQVLGTLPSVGNLTFGEFSPDGNWLMVCGATAPFLQILPVTVTTTAGVVSMTLGTAITKPATAVNSAPLCCRWHPTMERVAVANATTVVEYSIYRATTNSIMGTSTLAFGPIVPATSVNTGVVSCRYTPDGSHILIPDSLAGKMFQAWSLRDCQTLWVTTVQVGPTVATGITQGNDALVTPNGQYLVMGGAGGAVFLQTSPWNLGVQMGVTLQGLSAS